MPWHQGNTVSRLSGASIPVCLVPGAGHSPVSESPALFCEALLRAVSGACVPGSVAQKLAHQVPLSNLMNPFYSSYSTSITSSRIVQLYALLYNVWGIKEAICEAWIDNDVFSTLTHAK